MIFLATGLISCMILLLYHFEPTFRFYSHFILSLLVHGVSGGKIYLLLSYFTAIFWVLFLVRKKHFKKIPQANKNFFYALISIGAVGSLCSFVFYLLTYELPIEAHHYHFKEIYNSVNYLPHIHTSKLFLYKFFNLIGFEVKNMDDGRVFINAIPALFPWTTLLATVLLTLLSFYLIPQILGQWDKRDCFGIALLTTLSFYSLIKGLSDGGPFAYDFLLATITLTVLLNAGGPGDLIAFLNRRWKLFFWVLFGILSLKCLLDLSLGIVTYTLKHGLSLLCIYLILYFLLIRNGVQNQKLKWLLSVPPAFLLIFTLSQRYLTYIAPFHLPLEKGTIVHYFHYKDRPLPERLKEADKRWSSDFLNVYQLTTKNRETALHLYQSLGENPYRNRHIAIITPERSRAYGILARLIPLEFKDKMTSIKIPEIFDVKLTREDSKESFLAEVGFDPEYFPAFAHAVGGKINQLDENHKFVLYYFLNRFFYHSGINEYIFVPIAFYHLK